MLFRLFDNGRTSERKMFTLFREVDGSAEISKFSGKSVLIFRNTRTNSTDCMRQKFYSIYSNYTQVS